jgi:hypothetical protein
MGIPKSKKAPWSGCEVGRALAPVTRECYNIYVKWAYQFGSCTTLCGCRPTPPPSWWPWWTVPPLPDPRPCSTTTALDHATPPHVGEAPVPFPQPDGLPVDGALGPQRLSKGSSGRLCVIHGWGCPNRVTSVQGPLSLIHQEEEEEKKTSSAASRWSPAP